MHRSLNRVELIGRLGADPELFTSEAGLAVCTFWLITEDFWKDQTGNAYEAVEWHRVVVWDRLADDCYNYFVCGDLMYAEGHLTTRIWHDTLGQPHFVTELVADRVSLLHRAPDIPGHGETIFIPENSVRASEPYGPPTHPDLVTQRKLLFGISKA